MGKATLYKNTGKKTKKNMRTKIDKNNIRDIKEMKKIWENSMEVDDESYGFELFEISYQNGKAHIYCDSDDSSKFSQSCTRLIKKTKELFENAKSKDFYPEINKSLLTCFKQRDYEPTTLQNSIDYALIDLDSDDLSLVSFCTVQYDLDISSEFTVEVQQPNKGPFLKSSVHYIWNVCKNSAKYASTKGVCNRMISKVLNTIKNYNDNAINNYNDNAMVKNNPVFLNVTLTNEPAIKCYQQSGFSPLLYTPSTTRGLLDHIQTLIKLPNIKDSDGMMYYSDSHMVLTDKSGNTANIIPSITEKFALMCHGSLNTGIYKLIDNKGTIMVTPRKEEYKFPIKKIGIFGFPGTSLIAPTKTLDDEKIIPSLICTSLITPNEEHTIDNINMKYVLNSSNFGVNKDEDVSIGRDKWMGLWHCNRSTLLFDWDTLKKHDWKMNLTTVFQYIDEYAKKLHIPLSSIELNIFACRGYGFPNTPSTCVNMPMDTSSTVFGRGGSKTPSKKVSPIMVLSEPKQIFKSVYTESPENLIRKALESRNNYCKSTNTKGKSYTKTQRNTTNNKNNTNTKTRKSISKTV